MFYFQSCSVWMSNTLQTLFKNVPRGDLGSGTTGPVLFSSLCGSLFNKTNSHDLKITRVRSHAHSIGRSHADSCFPFPAGLIALVNLSLNTESLFSPYWKSGPGTSSRVRLCSPAAATAHVPQAPRNDGACVKDPFSLGDTERYTNRWLCDEFGHKGLLF